MNSVYVLINGAHSFDTPDGSRYSVETYARSRNELPSALRLKSSGNFNWTTELDCEGLPTSPHATNDAVDIFLEAWSRELIIVVGDRHGYAIRIADGTILGCAPATFTGRDSLDFFFASASPDSSNFAVASTSSVAIFAPSGRVLAAEAPGGLVVSCSWSSPSELSYTEQDANALSPVYQTRTIRCPAPG